MKAHPHILVALAISLSPVWARSQSIQFARERITINVEGSSCSLDADYYFKNNGSVAAGWSIFYPLLNTEALPFPDSIIVVDGSTGNTLPIDTSTHGVLFHLKVPPQSTKKIRVRYHQQTPAGKFEYILTTTKAWGRPLERAEFSIVVPDSLELISCSPSFDTKKRSGQETVYYIKRNNFMPDSNLIVQWKRRTQ